IAPSVAPMRLDQRELRLDRKFKHIRFAVYHARFLAFRKARTVARRRKYRAESCPSRLNTQRQIALRHELEFDLPRAKQRIEHLRIRLARKRANDLAHASSLQQRRQADLAVTGV